MWLPETSNTLYTMLLALMFCLFCQTLILDIHGSKTEEKYVPETSKNISKSSALDNDGRQDFPDNFTIIRRVVNASDSFVLKRLNRYSKHEGKVINGTVALHKVALRRKFAPPPITVLFMQPQRTTSAMKCSHEEVYDAKADKCRKTATPTKMVIKCNDNEIYNTESDKCIRKIYSGTRVPKTNAPHPFILRDDLIPATSTPKLMVPHGERQNMSCENPQVYHKHEYTVSSDNQSAVVIKKTGEVLQRKDYYINGTGTANEVIYICRKWPYCSKQWLPVKKGEFVLLRNQSIFVKDLNKMYNTSEYVWQNDTVILCEYVPLPKVQTININCSGTWVLIEHDEFQVLNNKSIYVNTSKVLYTPSEYTWQKERLFVCGNFTNDIKQVTTISNTNGDILSILTLMCISISIIALVFVLVTYCLFAELRTPPGINLMNLSVSILLAQLLWLVGSGRTDNPMACTAIAVLLHYFFLVSFVWTSIIAFDTWKAFTAEGTRSLVVSKRKRRMHSLRYMAVGWLSVMVYVAICVALDQSDTVLIGYGSRDACWIADNNAKLYFFGIPVGLAIVFNIVFFSMTVKAIRETRNQSNLINEKMAAKRDFGVYVRIASVMGFTWVFGFAAPFGWLFLAYVFVILNSLQGFYIAIAFALSKRARNLYAKSCQSKHATTHGDNGKTQETAVVSTQMDSKNGRTTVTLVKSTAI